MGYRGKAYSHRLNDLITCKYESSATKDDLGFNVHTVKTVDNVPCNVQQLQGSRLLYFQSQGYIFPLEIRLRKTLDTLVGLNYQGTELVIKSITEDNYNSSDIIVIADKETLDNDN